MLIYQRVGSKTLCPPTCCTPHIWTHDRTLPSPPRKKRLDFVSGDGQVPDALEFAVMDMKKGEKAMENAAGFGAFEERSPQKTVGVIW